MPFDGLRGSDIILALLLLVAWGILGHRMGRLAFHRALGRLRFGARTRLALLVSALLLVAAKLVVVQQFFSYGWLFGRDQAALAVVLLVLPALAVLVFSVPRLWRISRWSPEDRKEPTNHAYRSEASHPRLVVPVQVTAVGAFLSFYATAFRPTPTALGAGFFVLAAVFAAGVAALFFRLRRRWFTLSDPSTHPREGIGRRSLRATAIVAAFGVGVVAWYAVSVEASRLPERTNMGDHGTADYGGGPEFAHGADGRSGSGLLAASMVRDGSHGEESGHRGGGDAVSVSDLTGPKTGEPDRRSELTAREGRVSLDSGKVIDAWTFDGESPGPEIRVREGDLVEVKLRNESIERGVTIHWHGLDVPNAEDGVAGMTQDAVMPGEEYTYRFRAEQVGSFWYHSHQVSSEQVEKGLFGPLIIEPKEDEATEQQPELETPVYDVPVMAHRWDAPGEEDGDSGTSDAPSEESDLATLGLSDGLDRRAVEPGTKVRLRLVNTETQPRAFTVTGTLFRVTAIDGVDLNEPTDLMDAKLKLAAGGRYDVEFVMPETPVRLADLDDPGLGILLSRDGEEEVEPVLDGPEFDPTRYGSPAPTPFGPESDFDREFVQVFDGHLGFYDGRAENIMSINGQVFPDAPMLMVQEGDLAKATFVNRSISDHPMHLHGHHVLVLSCNGRPVTGSPVWMDTVNVAPGETWEVAFRADNPGLWMDHCHNLEHAANGMTMHLGYEGVTTPFEVGRATDNHPE